MHNTCIYQKTLDGYIDGIKQDFVGCIFTQTANQTVGNTTSEISIIGTGVGTLILPANFWAVGKTLLLRLDGYISALNSATTSVRIKLNSTTLVESLNSSMPSLVNSYFSLELLITCRSVGTSGKIYTQGKTTVAGVAGLGSAYIRELITTAPVTVNTTVAAAISATYQWSSASTSNSLTSTNGFIEILK